MASRRKDRDVYIYGLFDPLTHQIKYVGRSVSPESRLSGHINGGNDWNANPPKAEWIQSLIDLGLEPEMFIFEKVPYAEFSEAEKFWISYFNFIGADLLNIRETKRWVVKPRGKRMTAAEREVLYAAHLESEQEKRCIEVSEKFRRLGIDQQRAITKLIDTILG